MIPFSRIRFASAARACAALLVAILATASAGAAPAAAPKRIVSLAPNLTEMLFAIGAGPQVVGVTDFCDYPAEVLRLPRVGGFVNPNPEAVLALAPDLVVATPNVGNQVFVERLMRLGTRVTIVQARNVEEIFPALDELGRASGHEDGARGVAARLRDAIKSARARAAAHGPRVRVLFCIQIEPLIAAGAGSYPDDLLTIAGGQSIVPASAGAYPNLSLEQVVASAPQVIVQTRMDTREGREDAGPLQRYWERWPSIPAVAARRVSVVPGDALLRPGPRLVEGLALLESLLHPEPAPERAPAASKPSPPSRPSGETHP